MGFPLYPKHKSLSAVQIVRTAVLRPATTAFYSSGEAFSVMTNHAFPSGKVRVESTVYACRIPFFSLYCAKGEEYLQGYYIVGCFRS